MSDLFINTSYKQQYIVVSSSADGVVLRPANEDSLDSYWREFISGYIDEPIPEDYVPTLYLTHIPPEVQAVDAYVDYAVEYPIVTVQYNGRTIDVSDRISVNHPNAETPGLYALDFMVSIGGRPTRVWRSWLSIEEPPILRRTVTPWNRDNRIVADINRLIIEPQFQEALYEAGVPIYNFQQANANTAVSQFALMSYVKARLFIKNGKLFISGPRLPSGTIVSISDGNGNDISLTLNDTIVCPLFDKTDIYMMGSIVTYCGVDYYAIQDIPLVNECSVLPTSLYYEGNTSTQCWISGTYYTTQASALNDGEYKISSLWAVIDVNGYLFKMDLIRAFPIHHYWGHYNRKYFYDYASGDLVSVVKDNVVSLYQRNDVSIDEKGLEETYTPGHYRNPHWIEVYSESNSTELINPIIRPYSNATNTIVCKTYSAREEAFRMYSDLVGIPTEIVDALGSKYSVLLWSILYRTRETFPGIRVAFNSIGLDISNLHRVCPSIEYKDAYDNVISNVYTEIEVLKNISKAVEADRIWSWDKGDIPPHEDSDYSYLLPPWIAYSNDGNSVWQFNEDTSEWDTIYTFRHIGNDIDPTYYDYSVNNRYYRADLNLLARLSQDGLLDLGGDISWIDHNYYAGLSVVISKLLAYEIPIYIYFKLKVHLASIGHSSMVGSSNGCVLHEAWCGSTGLKVYPGKVFNLATCTVDLYYPTVLYAYDYPGADSLDSQWETAYDYTGIDNYRYYSFNQSVYIRMVYSNEYAGYLYNVGSFWTSRYTIGCMGNYASPGTDDYEPSSDDRGGFNGFMDASLMQPLSDTTHSNDVLLIKGIVGCTLKITTGTFEVEATCLKWNYVFDSTSWTMDESLKFADWGTLDGVKMLGCWAGDLESFKNTITRCASPDMPGMTYAWDEDEDDILYIGGGVPEKIMLFDRMGYLMGLILVPYDTRIVLDAYASDYLLKLKLSIV